MELRKLFTMIFIIGLSTFSVVGQSLNTLSDEELEAKKKEAIASENFELAKQIKAEQDARKSIDDKLKEKNEALTAALAAEDFEKAEALKKEIAQLEADKAKLKELEEDRKIAIFQERYDDVIALETQIANVKAGKKEAPAPTPVTPAAPSTNTPEYQVAMAAINQTNPSTNSGSRKSTAKDKAASHKKDLLEKPYNTKVIGMFNAGFRSGTYTERDSYGYTYSYDYSVIAYHFSNSRWWANKYLAGGTFFNFAFPEEGTIDGGAHIMGFADFDSPILPYTALGFGMGLNMDTEEFYTPIMLRIGSHLFFNKHRSFGLSVEYMQYFNNEFIPKLRLGLVWTRMKRKHNTWVQNK